MHTAPRSRAINPRAFFALVLLSAPTVGVAAGTNGATSGNVGLIDTSTQAYGFSASTNLWTSRTLDSPAVVRLAGEFLGLLRTGSKLLLYNSTNDRWVSCSFAGTPLGEEVEGATAVVWTTSTLYGCAAHWTVWKTMAVPSGETPVGGGSAGNFGLAWSTHKAYAFYSAPGTWVTQDLDGPCLGGIANGGLGLIWTSTSAYSFDPSLGSWVHHDLGATAGVSVAGDGDVALVWGDQTAQAYSAPLGGWYTASGAPSILGGAASGEIALFWSSTTGYSFNAATGTWSQIAIQGASATNDGPGDFSLVTLGPNPAVRSMRLAWRESGERTVRVLDVAGRELRTLEGVGAVDWDLTDARGERVPNGSYWLQVEGSGGVEARRIVIAH
ncbi:MAG: T9SS type A sorting domain-containing protein [Candidatus Eisenbacteria bacterium]